MRLALDTPVWLLALPLVALVAVLGRRERGAGRLATAARAGTVGLLVLALAGPRVGLASSQVDVAFVVDGSDSVGAARAEALDWVRAALAARDDGERAALGLFGRDARLDHSLRADPPPVDPAVVVDGSASDLEQALRLAQGAVGSEHRRRVVLLSDGRQTTGDALAGARELAAAGVGLDVVPLAGGVPPDVLVAQVAAPNRVRDGEAYDVRVRLRNTGDVPAEAVVVVTADDEEVLRDTRVVPPGPEGLEVVVPREADAAGTVRYRARIESGASTVAANDAGSAAVRVDGPPRVLVYQRAAGLGADLAAALDASGVPVDVRAADVEPLPALDRLLDYDSVVLVDVPAPTLGEAGMAALDAYVRDAGRGLVAVGGEQSFALGDYDGTALEGLLPVFASVTDPRTRPPVAEALVVDTSGSMAACHCADEDVFGPAPAEEGGVNKTDISREAVARAIDALEAQDTVGVLAFNSVSDWVVPLQQLPSEAVVDEGLARLHPEGNTDIAQAVREAIAGLRDTDARLRHIVLFTDGFTSTPGLVEVAEEASAAGITLSVVATGEGPRDLRQTLQRMAEAGGGRFYPGRDLQSIPNILAAEVRLVARPVVNEGSFLPVVTGAAPATEGLTESPPLLGYLATTAKPTAQTLLRIGQERDPLLASWQPGLGTATAWTSDATARWSAQWVTWDRYAAFWSSVVRDTFPAQEDARGGLSATATPDGVAVELQLAEAAPPEAEAVATVTTPSGDRVEVPLERTGLDTFAARAGAGAGGEGLDAEGVYAVTAQVTANGQERYRGTVTATRSYPAEYAVEGADPALLERVAAAAGGRLDPDPATVFDPAGLAAGEATRALWPLLAVLALVLVPVDVGLRRLRLERADWARVRAWLGAWARPRVGGRDRPARGGARVRPPVDGGRPPWGPEAPARSSAPPPPVPGPPSPPPATPPAPADPAAPATPGDPAAPATPGAPDAPTTPGDPAAPAGPPAPERSAGMDALLAAKHRARRNRRS